jgi:hypothetical protein
MKIRLNIALSFLISATSHGAETDFGAWAERTLSLRAEVEDLAKRVDEVGKAQTSEREQLRQRRLELASLLRKEESRAAQLSEKRDRLKRRLRVEDSLPAARKKELLAWLHELRTEVSSSLPFHRAARLEVLSDLEKRIERGESYDRLVAELWNATEKELKLTRENAFEVMSVMLPEGERKAEVARAGMIQLAFVTADGHAGFAKREGAAWSLREGANEEESQAARRMVERFRDQGVRGYFELPLPTEAVQ